MAVAERYGMPRSIVLGGPLPAPGDPLWLPDDLEWAIAYEQYKQSVCSGCGMRRDEDPETYVTKLDRCPGCYELAIADEDIPEDERSRAMRSVLVPAASVDRQDEIRDAAHRLGLRHSLRTVG